VYHLQLRQFPHNLCRFNLTDAQLRPVIEPWAHDHWVELDDRKWNPYQAKLTILEGPELPVQQLSMGRGWRNAQRGSRDVTERVLAAARQASGTEPSAPDPGPTSASPQPASVTSPEVALLADSLALELLSLLERDAVPLSQAWRLAQARLPDRAASESLALAEQAVTSLLGRRLIVLATITALRSDASDADELGGEVLAGEATERVLRAPESWLADGQPASVHMRRA
jgi:hypothetical protein